MELDLETELSKKPAQEPNDTCALTVEQQQALNRHKVRETSASICVVVNKIRGDAFSWQAVYMVRGHGPYWGRRVDQLGHI